MNYERIMGMLGEKCNKSREEIEEMVEQKRLEFGGLISAEGAAHIIAKDFGISFSNESTKIADIRSSPASVEGVVESVLSFREFEKNGRKGKVANVVLSDGTGSIRTVLWDKDAELVATGRLGEGSVVKLANAMVKVREGVKELTPGRFGSIDVLESRNAGFRKYISLLAENQQAEVRGCLVRVFDSKPFFMHNGKEALVVRGVVDDGTASIRCVFFGEAAEGITGLAAREALSIFGEKGQGGLISEFRKACGREFVITGRAKINDYSQSLEMVAGDVRPTDPKAEAERMLSALE